jgi:hypothetical protein
MDGNVFIEDYYYESLPPLYYEDVIMLENRVLNEMNIDDIISLGILYKVGVVKLDWCRTFFKNKYRTR